MTIQWYPGHMQKARREIKKAMFDMDLVIEVLDARIPLSSENPLVSELRGPRPVIKVLNKSDLADPKITQLWLRHLAGAPETETLAVNAKSLPLTRKLIARCRSFFPGRNEKALPLRAMVVGIPNCGKSTLINTLAGKAIAKVRDEPAVTRHQQQIKLGNGILLNDSPGILWPQIENERNGYCLAMTGAIKNTAFDFESVAHFAATFLLENAADALMTRYRLKTLPEDETALLEMIGRKRGCLGPGGVTDVHQASEVLLHDFRNGALGRISLEAPEIDL